tara:strand:+ start:854 stop:1741 length:888 start_codon:yes stop_codon:yes gene_type:complete
MNLPNFICLGATKSGTTTLYDILRQHPEIYVPAFKEPHFFDIPENYKNGIDWYQKNYFKNVNKKVIAEFTPSYFFDKEVPERIFNNLGSEVKFVVLLRHPVDRAYSHYLHSKRDEHEELDFVESLNQEEDRLSRYIENKDYLSYLRNSYISQGLYGDMVERYLKYFKLENFMFIHFEKEFLLKRDKTIHRVLNFLDIDSQIELQTDLRSNPSSKEKSKTLKRIMKKKGWWRTIIKWLLPSIQFRQIIRNRVQRLNIKEYRAEKISEELKSKLFSSYFRDNIDKFERLTDKKMNWK